jgi:Restriction endonuclease
VAPRHSKDKEYELLTQAVYQTILMKEGHENIEVQHDVKIKGRSGTTHQVDVLWRFKQAGVEHTVLVECKNYTRKIDLGKIRSFKSVIDDLGPCQGIMVTTTGYQSGVETFARHNGISLKLLRRPTPEILAGGIQIQLNVHLRTLSTKHPITVKPIVSKAADDAQAKRLIALNTAGDVNYPPLAELVLFDGEGRPKPGLFAEWLQRQLNLNGREIGGPYSERIVLADHYYPINMGKPNQELVPLDGFDVELWVDGVDETIAFHAHQLVEAILRDHFTGEIEHIHRLQ